MVQSKEDLGVSGRLDVDDVDGTGDAAVEGGACINADSSPAWPVSPEIEDVLQNIQVSIFH